LAKKIKLEGVFNSDLYLLTKKEGTMVTEGVGEYLQHITREIEVSIFVVKNTIQPDQSGFCPFITLGKSPILQSKFKKLTSVQSVPKAAHQLMF
jgi:hypothetical protein